MVSPKQWSLWARQRQFYCRRGFPPDRQKSDVMLQTNIAVEILIVAAVSLIEKADNMAQLSTSPQALDRASATRSAHCGVPPGVGLRPKWVSGPEFAGKPK